MNETPTAISLFSGIGGMDEGLRRAGFRHQLFCEVDEYRRTVLCRRFIGTSVYRDVRELGAAQLAGRGVDLLCGGFPCQDLSVSGKRRGLAGERSGLFFEFARCLELVRPRWLLIENVPGLLSSHSGRDFGVVLDTLADLGYGMAWRVLDSRFFGVPQRRRRVFIVGAVVDGDPRAAADRAGQVLALGSRCRRHPATSRGARPDLAGAITGRSPSRLDDQGTRNPAVDPTYYVEDDANGTLLANGKEGQRVDKQPLLVANTLEGHNGKEGSGISPEDTFVVAAPLSHGSNPNSNMAGRRQEDDVNLVAYNVFPEHGQGAVLTAVETDVSQALSAINGQAHDRVTLVADVTFVSENQRAEIMETEYARQLTGGGGKPGQGYPAVRQGAAVRRLMPVECERLQGLPDGWTDLGDTADSPRYAALGDAVTVPVAEWIGRRILTVRASACS
jgi:DNA (cytosine-5)-methyltransferase 1